jgi:hypothetical protein
MVSPVNRHVRALLTRRSLTARAEATSGTNGVTFDASDDEQPLCERDRVVL